MATIIIQRNSEYNNGFRNYKIFLDEQHIGNIANGETKEFKTNAGSHTVMAKIDWCSSPDISIDINENETKTLKLGGFKNGNLLMPIAGGIAVLHFILKMIFRIEYTIFLLIPFILYVGNYVTFKRREYLTLSEVK